MHYGCTAGALNRCTELVHCGCTELFSRWRAGTGALRVHCGCTAGALRVQSLRMDAVRDQLLLMDLVEYHCCHRLSFRNAVVEHAPVPNWIFD